MGQNTKIQWTDDSWCPIRAITPEGRVGWHCAHASPGCINCYSETVNKRFGTGLAFSAQNADKVRVYLDDKMLRAPLSRRKPKHIFVAHMTDLFADFVTDDMIDRVFGVMITARHHTFQVLTKRAERMRAYMARWQPDGQGWMTPGGQDAYQALVSAGADRWPLPNVWLGVSVEDQRRADERREHLRETPAARRWYSVEPMLEPIDLRLPDLRGGWLDWVVVGGESGLRARPCALNGIRSVVDQCRAVSVPVFVKQLGARPVWDSNETSRILVDKKGGDIEEWPHDLRVREFPDA